MKICISECVYLRSLIYRLPEDEEKKTKITNEKYVKEWDWALSYNKYKKLIPNELKNEIVNLNTWNL